VDFLTGLQQNLPFTSGTMYSHFRPEVAVPARLVVIQ
jgi:hypothetical protein